MKNRYFIIVALLTLSLISCEKAFLDPEPTTDLESVFETFWTLVDENYCFFEEKNIDWNELYNLNRNKINNETTSESSLKVILEEMLNELKDGHVNLYSDVGRSRYDYQEGYLSNFDWDLLYRKYMSNSINYQKDRTFRSAIIDSVLYLNIASFGQLSVDGKTDLNPITIGVQFDELLGKSPGAKGLIIDVRNNSGGNLGNPDAILARLIKERALTYYFRPKSGPRHNDFAEATPYFVEPRAPYFDKQVVLLTNRSSYSATNYFASAMKLIPKNVTLVGGVTGGGGGSPVFKDLPNGWLIRLSSVQLLSGDREQIEEGVEPDIVVDMSEEDIEDDIDTILETALALFN